MRRVLLATAFFVLTASLVSAAWLAWEILLSGSAADDKLGSPAAQWQLMVSTHVLLWTFGGIVYGIALAAIRPSTKARYILAALSGASLAVFSLAGGLTRAARVLPLGHLLSTVAIVGVISLALAFVQRATSHGHDVSA